MLRNILLISVVIVFFTADAFGEYKIVIGNTAEPFADVAAWNDNADTVPVTTTDAHGYYILRLKGTGWVVENMAGTYRQEVIMTIYPVVWMPEIGEPPLTGLNGIIYNLQELSGLRN